MDVFIEQLVKRKSSPLQFLLKTAIVVFALILFFALIILAPYLQSLSGMMIIGAAGILYGTYYLLSSMNVEYEYISTNGDLDIDKIIAKRKRKRILSVNCKDMEFLKTQSSYSVRREAFGKILDVTQEENHPGNWCFSVRHKTMGKVLVIFTPSQRTLDSIKPYLSKQVMTDAFGRD